MRGSSRLDGVPEYLSTRLMRTVAEARARGVDVISLGIGDPDTPPPAELREELCAQARRDEIHGYPTNHGIAPLREAVAAPLPQPLRRGARSRARDPAAARRQGRPRAPLPRPARSRATSRSSPIPATRSTTAGRHWRAARPSACPCAPRTASCPISAAIDAAPARRAGLLICGYPNNPTGAVADVGFFERLAAWGAEHGVPICHDNAYAELTYDGLVAPSFLAAPGAREAGIEIYSLSKSLSLPGWRIAFAVGNAELIGRLRTLKTNIDSGMWLALQHAAITRRRADPVVHGRPARALRPPPRRALRRARGPGHGLRAPARRAVRVDARPRRRGIGRVRRAVARARGRRRRAGRGLRPDERRLRAALADGAGGAPRARPSSASAARSEARPRAGASCVRMLQPWPRVRR